MRRALPEKTGNSSFSIIDDENENFDFDESILVENARDISSPTNISRDYTLSRKNTSHEDDTDSDEYDIAEPRSKRFVNTAEDVAKTSVKASTRISGRQTVARIRSARPREILDLVSTESESDEIDVEVQKKSKKEIMGIYNPAHYEELDVGDDVKELFQYITKYVPQQLNLDFKFKPFIPDFIPAVGDIDAFLKVIPPELSMTAELFDPNKSQLGLKVLDEPAANQSDPALLHLQLRATSVNVSLSTSVVVKKIESVQKNPKTIDKWVKDITDLHKSKSAPIVRYTSVMPELDDLMQEWPDEFENILKIQGFPSYKLKTSLEFYVDIVCTIFDIPVQKNKIQSLHMLFCLYAAVKNSQFYRSNENKDDSANIQIKQSSAADQLVLE